MACGADDPLRCRPRPYAPAWRSQSVRIAPSRDGPPFRTIQGLPDSRVGIYFSLDDLLLVNNLAAALCRRLRGHHSPCQPAPAGMAGEIIPAFGGRDGLQAKRGKRRGPGASARPASPSFTGDKGYYRTAHKAPPVTADVG